MQARESQGQSLSWVALALCLVAVLAVPMAEGKSLYLAAEHHQSLFDAWNINPDGTVSYQATYQLQYATDPAGVALDEDSGTLFITSEFSGGVEIVDPVTLTYMGVSPGPGNLAGIDVEDASDIVFAVRRNTDDLYIFQWDPVATTMTQVTVIDLPNCTGAYGLALDETRDILWIADTAGGVARAYDVDVAAWANIQEIPALRFQPSHKPVDIAVDRRRNLVYTVSLVGGASLPPNTGSTLLSKWDVAAQTETTVDMGHGGVGVVVDEISGYVYVTGGAYVGDNVSVWDPSVLPFTEVDDTGPIGNPAGMAIAGVSYNPLHLVKEDGIPDGQPIAPGSPVTYTVCYDNLANAFAVENVTITDHLPTEARFVSATGGGTYSLAQHTVTWNIGTLAAGAPSQSLQVVVRVDAATPPGTIVVNHATITSDQTGPTTVDEETITCSTMVNRFREPGSLLVFPLIDNTAGETIIEIANRGSSNVWLKGFMIGLPGGTGEFEKKDFVISLTPKEPFWWNTRKPLNTVNAQDQINQIQGFDDIVGFCFVWAVDSRTSQKEIDHDYLMGSALYLQGSRAYRYEAVPHQGLAVQGDYTLKLDGTEYAMGSSQIMIEGFAAGTVPGLGGILAVCNLDIDFVLSIQPEFDINVTVWNQYEVPQTRHLHCYQFQMYDLVNDLQVTTGTIFTPKFQLAATSTHAMWAVFVQAVGGNAWGSSVWPHPAAGVPATVILDEVPMK